jgi:DNA-binding HxlR family transcriptional regulator
MAKSTKRADLKSTGPVPKRRSPCPVACTLDLLGDKWTLLLVRDLFCGKAHFNEFGRSPERIATNILADRLGRLVAARLVDRVTSPDQPGRDRYVLTAKGRTLWPVLQAVAEWGLANIDGTKAHLSPTPAPN